MEMKPTPFREMGIEVWQLITSPLGGSKDLDIQTHTNKLYQKMKKIFKNSKEDGNIKISMMGLAQNIIVRILNVIFMSPS